MRRHDLLGRILGTVVFVAGVVLLVIVFSMAYGFFHSPGGQLQSAAAPGSSVSASSQLGRSAMNLAARIVLLVVMALVGSLLAARGAQLYFAAMNHHPRDVETDQS